MKCQWRRSSEPNANDACCRCSGVRLARNFVAAAAIEADERSAAMKPPASHVRHMQRQRTRGGRTVRI